MAKRYSQLPFERFADDAIVHCRTEVEAQEVRGAIAERLKECGLEPHPEKTKVVYARMMTGEGHIRLKSSISRVHVSAEEIVKSQGKVLHQFQSRSF